MDNLIKLLSELKEREFKISDTTKGEQIQQTQRNQLKAELLNAIREDIAQAYEYVYQSDEGILIEIANDSIADGLKNDDGSGAITACLDIKIKNLDCNAENESEDFMRKLREKAEKKKALAEQKAAKMAKDKAERERKKAERETKGA